MKKIRKYGVMLKVSFANAVAYRAYIFPRFFFYTLFIYIFMNLWRAIYREGSVHGYSYVQIVWYLIMTELIVFGCCGDVFRRMNDDVRSGGIAYMLGRPVHYMAYQFIGNLGQVLLNAVCFGALAAVLGFAFVGPLPGFRFGNVPLLLCSVGLGVLINFFLMMLIGLSAFVMEDNNALYFIY